MAFNPGAGPAPTSYECQNCGAKLPPPTAEGTQICNYCQAVYHVERAASSPQGFTIVFGSGATGFGNVPPAMGSFPQPSAQAIDAMMNAGIKTAKWSLWIGLIITIIVIASVAVPLYLVFKDGVPGLTSGSSSTPKLGAIDGSKGLDLSLDVGVGMLLPAEPNASQNVVMLSRYYDQSAKASKVVLVRLDTNAKKIVWQSTPFEDASGQTKITMDLVNVYLDDKQKVRAIKLADGTDAWVAPLPDKIKAGCRSQCFAISGGRVIAHTDDGQLVAIDTVSGKPSWSRKLKDTSARSLAVGDTLVVLDGEKGTYDLTLVNAADGAETGKIVPTCASASSSGNDLRSESPVLAVPLANAIIVGTGTFDGCWDRYELATPATPVFSTPISDINFSSSTFFNTVFGPNQMLWAESSGSGGISVLDLTTGAVQNVMKDEGYRFEAVGIVDGKAIVRATNQRGTQKMSVWAIDLATGTKAWEKSFGDATSMDTSDRGAGDILSSNESMVTIQVGDGKVRDVQVSSNASGDITITSEALDPATGVAAAVNPPITLGKVIGVNEAVKLGWNGGKAILVVSDKLQVIDTDTGKQVASIP